MTKEKIIVIVGPTAVGKTALGIALAGAFNGEIISGDSQQVYRRLDIGTAKASAKEQALAVHHLIDIREVTESYSAFDFVQDAKRAIEDIVSRGKLPIIVGGTGLYLQSLLEGYHLGGDLDQKELLAYRQQLEILTDAELYQRLANKGIHLDQVNRRRAIRSLELNQFARDLENQEAPYNPLIIGLTDEREVIYERINKRVDQMMASGLLEEARWLFEKYPAVQASRGIGYKELFPYFQGRASLEEATATLKQHTRRFAKRQLTWFRNRMAVRFDSISEASYPQAIYDRVERFLKEP
ncbi:TPA: tRNA (adenosine(37)-N6)-dimethylallyltransferase MiaA [Streptococcus equi subsp. zooepidemicus]|uniref:tRNA dimethylallyltransferase n=1 Tax=Streptococcus equi subsp. ruminatorum CECT 5772 TaxID=1051981 RepID=A0A922T247_9STRE|nr:tRNA (adenosine(37)-N6)-dimethylallyltransferase MiaA [Streptococcus equi]KED03598.1 tRNA delta(2)-isopentenylpyrophosphate transferase [Streptococcus equi subsp. ruminatorum CECT 5772]HEL0246131.1 tRNA (adenosine(37)-N6)-dimethylallyltransferase MiaA [Streptococcus equi subsp. zooepidemicus]HEL1011246.1 tRNA (adenosine(37)-N6)-dimethylallyltransferase MiaA [Streptococcus equi subsp. ruminatorum]HEL1023274.1 tRNA (adenosine(37)-N6)-dimethylallyltransferase MiaA [Streptococcus equi subsp. rum